MIPSLSTILQVAALLLISLIAGATFGIWRGYDPAGWPAPVFTQVHQGAVQGLNTLLPALGLLALLATAWLAFAARNRPDTLWLYVGAALLIMIAGAITRFGNQPINAEIMNWSLAAPPENWTALRDTWWHWHIARVAASIGAQLVLVSAIFADRSA